MTMHYNLTKKRSAFALFRCSHCNQLALQKVVMMAQASYNDKGSGFGQRHRSTMEERARLADGSADDVMDQYLAEMRENKSAKVYAKARLSCACPHCGKREPWALMNTNWLFWLAVAGFAAMVICGVSGFRLGTYIGLGVGIAGVALQFGWRSLMVMCTAKQMQTCPPLFETELQELKRRGLRNRGYASMDWDALMKDLAAQNLKR